MSKHKAVALAWIPNPQNLPIINHKDENKLNCFYLNLEWCTSSYNNSYNGTGKKRSEKFKKDFFVYNLERDLMGKRTGIKTYCKENGFKSFRSLTSTLTFNSKNPDRIRSYNGIYPLFEKQEKEEILTRIKNSTNRKGQGGYGPKAVYQYSLDGELLDCFSTVHEAASFLNVNSISTISACCRGERKQAYCYKWSYIPL